MVAPEQDILQRILPHIYPVIKAQHPSESRRKRVLRVAEHFWSLDSASRLRLLQRIPPPVTDSIVDDHRRHAEASFLEDLRNDADPYDEITESAELGLLIRTDFSDDVAWDAFCAALLEAERDLLSTVARPTPDQGILANSADGHESDDDDDGSGDEPPSVFRIVNPADARECQTLAGVSNLSALRLFADLAIRPVPNAPPTPRVHHPPHRLVDLDGWQEVYEGKDIWIYDAQSNRDHSVRVVSKCGNEYGTATADSWRARVSHICELQVNLYIGAMTINFGGLDRWNHAERRRNMDEAVSPVT